MATESVYVLFATKGDYRLAIRTPALNFGGARIHIDRMDGSLTLPKDVADIFELKGTPPNKEPMGTYVTVAYDVYADTKTGIQTSFIDRKAIAHYPEVLLDTFSKFLDYLESKSVIVHREVAITVYMDTVEEGLVDAGFYPPKGTKPETIERITGKVGSLPFTTNIK